MLGWFRNAWIFNYRINCSRMLSWIIFFFSSTFIAITNPVLISRTRKTFPNFPSPSFCKNLKFYLERRWIVVLSLIIGLGLDLKKAGEELGDTRLLEWCSIDVPVPVYFIIFRLEKFVWSGWLCDACVVRFDSWIILWWFE